MIEITFSPSFKKAFKKTIKANLDKQDKFWNKVSIFIENPFDKRLNTHKLSGRLKNLWSFKIDYDIRVLFYFAKETNKAVFVDIGKHDDVY